ncbi:hypothetical protein BGZ76_008523 [Entomortierella beljakovae]|nr:hypothetical protein BGZ76_008523 [Entomortierella beljakovae]
MAEQELREYSHNIRSWLKAFPSNIPRYALERLPITKWLPRYSRKWVLKDIIAGATVGLIVVPQGMSYAKVAGLPVQHGLYSAYIGAIFYCFMGTSKDVNIGPTAIISLITGELVSQLADRFSPAQIAGISSLAVGALTLILGVLQLGIILDFFPSTVLVGYTTGAAATIVMSQIPKWIGVSGVNTREPAYRVLINTVKALPTLSWLDLLFGWTSMLGLVGIGYVIDRWSRGRFSVQLVKISRFFFVTVLATAFSFLININAPLDTDGNIIPRISILKDVPSGLPEPQVPIIDRSILIEIAPKLIAIVLATILEHIAIAKAFANKSRYQIDSNQELLTIGLTNVTASFFGAYTVTGSFSRSAVKFQCGVKTPLAGLFTGALVLLALHWLTPLFYYIPDAALSSVIMVAVSGLISPPDIFKEFYHINLWDFLSSQIALWVTIFVSVEAGIAAGVGFSIIVLLFRIARPQFRVMEPLRTRPDIYVAVPPSSSSSSSSGSLSPFTGNNNSGRRSNKVMNTISPPPGILVFRIEEGVIFPNMTAFKLWAQNEVYRYTRFGGITKTAENRLWSDNLDVHIQTLRSQKNHEQGYLMDPQHQSLIASHQDDELPFLRAVILDCSSVNHIDTTGLQGLRSLIENLKDYSGALDNPEIFFEFHFVSVPDNVLSILERSGLATPRSIPTTRQYNHRHHTRSNDRRYQPSHSRASRSHDHGHGHIAIHNHHMSTSYNSISSIGSEPCWNSLIHLTIQDAIESIEKHAEAWKKALGSDTISINIGGSREYESDNESDSDSVGKQPSTHELVDIN